MMPMIKHITPRQIESLIRESVKGQDEAIKSIATALSAHITRIANIVQNPEGSAIKKDGFLMVGSSGVGKTESLRVALKALHHNFDICIPFCIVDCSRLTSCGYKGLSADEAVLNGLLASAKMIVSQNPKKYLTSEDCSDEMKRKIATEKLLVKLSSIGIVVLDEVDKLGMLGVNEQADSYLRLVQCELLKLIEGGSGFTEDSLCQRIDTTNVMFVLAGAFEHMLNQPKIGYDITDTASEVSDAVTVPDTAQLITTGGLVRELCGRISTRCRFRDLKESDLYCILKESKISPVEDFKRLFIPTMNILKIDDLALHAVAEKAIKLQTGARGLRNILGEAIYPILYDIDGQIIGKTITVTEAVITKGASPLIEPIKKLPPKTAKH